VGFILLLAMFGSIAVTVSVKKDSGYDTEQFVNADIYSEHQVANSIDGSVFTNGQRRSYSSDNSSNDNSNLDRKVGELVKGG